MLPRSDVVAYAISTSSNLRAQFFQIWQRRCSARARCSATREGYYHFLKFPHSFYMNCTREMFGQWLQIEVKAPPHDDI